MKISQIQHGEPCTLLLKSESGAFSAEFDKGAEVRLVFPRTSDEVFVSTGGSAQTVEAVDDATRRRLTTLRETDPVLVCWIVARHERQGVSEVTVQAHRFRSRIGWTGTVSFGVDERVTERVARLAGRAMNSEQACLWLADHIFLPPIGPDSPTRAVATGSPDVKGRFRLLGARVAVDIAPHAESLRVESVVALRGGNQGFRAPEFLIEAELGFTDATAAGQMRGSVRAQIQALVAESDSYVGLWEKYQTIERENLIRRAKEIGWLTYHAFESLPSGLWRLRISDADALRRFRDRLGASGAEELEAAREVPSELLEHARDVPEAEQDGAMRPAVGTVEDARPDRHELVLRPLDEDSDVLPPFKGVIFAALQGDRKRLKRREEAVRRIKSADARLPQLALILEGENPYVRRTDRVQPFTPAVREVFDHEPTPEQRQAIDCAVNTPEVVLIQGPPGTGKTKVITAIQARLAELEADRPGVAGRTLLTSFQQDAVDHAVSKSRVFGLPPVRFGGRRGDRSSDEQVQRWAVSAREHVEGKLAELPEDRPLATYRRVRDRVASYASGRMSAPELRSLLDELLVLPVGHLPTELWERLGRLRRGPDSASSGTTNLERDLMLRAVRGLRTTPSAFSDDGPRKARQALAQLASIISDQETELLAGAAAVPPGEMFEGTDDLASLQRELLDRLSPGEVPGERRLVDAAVLEALNAAVSTLYDRMRQSAGGIADALKEYADSLREDPQGIRRLLEHYGAVYAATCQQAVSLQVVNAKGGEDLGLVFENVIVDEAARANPLDLFIPMSLAQRRIILVGDHRQLPHLLDPDVEKALAGTVREQEQHALKESLFQRLFERMPELKQNDEFIRVVTLRDQFRMHPVLGTFISDVFYAPHGEGFRSPRPANDFAHRLDGYQRAGRPVCAAWKNVPRREGEERQGRSKSRPAEAKWIAKEVRRLLVEAGTELSIGVISFYRAQVQDLLESLVREGIAERDPDSGEISILPEWRTLERRNGTREERLRVGTVDAFQGKEFDIVFLSATRSNALPDASEEDRRRKYGHLMLENRLCVAMSRQRMLLVVVGDREMFRADAAGEAVPGLAQFLALCGGEHGLVT